MIDALTKTSGAEGLSAIAAQRRREPAYVVQSETSKTFRVAKWVLPAHQARTGCQIPHILTCHLSGQAGVSKIVDGQIIRKRTGPGMITLIPSGELAEYSVGTETTLLELYIDPTLIQQFSEDSYDGRRLSIAPLFVAEDLWLTGYFRMLADEIESHGQRLPKLDSLLFGQAQQLLFNHLVRRYSGERPTTEIGSAAPNTSCALRPFLLKRVTEYIDAHINTDLRLGELAALVHLSENHFIRTFYAATGTTPYQFVLEKRLAACASRLRNEPATPIAEIARTMGFKSQAYFATKFRTRYGMTPTRYRQYHDD